MENIKKEIVYKRILIYLVFLLIVGISIFKTFEISERMAKLEGKLNILMEWSGIKSEGDWLIPLHEGKGKYFLD
jgi:hypothetical protein